MKIRRAGLSFVEWLEEGQVPFSSEMGWYALVDIIKVKRVDCSRLVMPPPELNPRRVAK